jgi:hypothetical protein
METTRKIVITAMVVALVAFLTGAARADWDEGDDHKMHYPQLPDPTGWDVYADATQGPPAGLVADDWQCSQTGPVDDIHIWGSWQEDVIDEITNVHVSIHADIPDPDGPTGPFYSMPGNLLWERDFSANDITVRPYGDGDQGFYIPAHGTQGVWPSDHSLFHQINIENIRNPFQQVEGTIYWLDIQVTHLTPDSWWGWKTSGSQHFMDDAVWWDSTVQDPTGAIIGGWQELRDPLTEDSLDMAFVITPEPATLLVLALGLIPALLRRRKKV